jgi:hypothetical protein
MDKNVLSFYLFKSSILFNRPQKDIVAACFESFISSKENCGKTDARTQLATNRAWQEMAGERNVTVISFRLFFFSFIFPFLVERLVYISYKYLEMKA